MTGSATVIRGDARHLPIGDDTVDLVVTSPPYFALRSYQDGGEHYDGQIGDEATPAEFVDALIEVTRECVRVLKPSGSLWVNLGDKYAGSRMDGGSGWATATLDHDTNKHQLSKLAASQGRLATRTTVPTKSLIGIPWRYAIRCIDELGLILRAEVIWSKPNGLPESVTDRVRRSHETWFHFTLAPRYYSAVDEIREEHAPQSIARTGRAYNAGDSFSVGQPNTLNPGQFCNPLGKLPGSVWTIPTEPLIVPPELGVDHFAAFPTEWPRRIIQGWSPAGVCVECGEGRRPVSAKTDSRREGGYRPDNNPLMRRPDEKRAAIAASTLGMVSEFTITGYACECTPRHLEMDETPHRACDGAGCYDDEGALICEPKVRVVLVYDWHLWTDPAPTTPGVVLDPFGGTGTTALVAKALGRTGITVDMSADYCRLATWRTNDPAQIAKAARREFTPSAKPIEGQFDLLEGIL